MPPRLRFASDLTLGIAELLHLSDDLTSYLAITPDGFGIRTLVVAMRKRGVPDPGEKWRHGARVDTTELHALATAISSVVESQTSRFECARPPGVQLRFILGMMFCRVLKRRSRSPGKHRDREATHDHAHTLGGSLWGVHA